MDEFLAYDFSRFAVSVLNRCRAIDGSRLFISGATGFFGRHLLSLLAHLHRMGVKLEVTALSRSPQDFLARHAWCRHFRWLKWQLGDAREPWSGTGPQDLLIHAATDTSATSQTDKLALFEGIMGGTRNALIFAATHSVRRVLLCGSGAQYGAITAGVAEGAAESSLLACDSTRPGSAYGEGKRASEMLAAVYAQRHGFDVVNTRCFAFVGPGLPLDGHFAIGNFIRNALNNEPIRLTSAGGAVRSYLYGADLAVWLLVLLLDAPSGCAVNVGSDRAVSIRELAHLVRNVLNPTLPVEVGDDQSAQERDYYFPSIARARSFGLASWTGLEQAIARTAEWYVRNA